MDIKRIIREEINNDLLIEGKLNNLFKKFNMTQIKKELKERLDIDETSTKTEVAKKLIKYSYNLNLKLLKYELGAVLGGFIFYFLSIVLDVAGVEPFVTDGEPTMPHFILWGAGALLNVIRMVRKDLKEEDEINDFDWVDKEEPLHPLLFELQDHSESYKIWFGSISGQEQERVKGVLFDLGLLPLNNVKKRVWLPHGGFDSLYLNYYDRHMGWGNEVDKWDVSHMGCSKKWGAPPHVVKDGPEWDSEKFGASWRCRKDGASYGEGLEFNKRFFDETPAIELPSSLI